MDYLQISEVSDGPFFAAELFRKAFGEEIPNWGHHLVCFYRKSQQEFVPLGYINFHLHNSVMLVGGGLTSGPAFAHVEDAHSLEIREQGGILFMMLKYGFARFADECDAYFGYAGDARALEVDLQAGFEKTRHQYLLAHFHKPVSKLRRRRLIEKISRIGSF